MRKIFLLMVVVTVAAPVLRETLGSGDANAKHFGWVGPLLGMGAGGGHPGASAPAVPPPAPEPQAAAPRPRPTGLPTISAISSAPVARGTGGGPPVPANAAATATLGAPRGAEGVITPELMRYLNPSFLPSQPGNAAAGANPQAPGAAAGGAPGRSQMIQTLIEHAKSNPTAFRDQLGAVTKALGGK